MRQLPKPEQEYVWNFGGVVPVHFSVRFGRVPPLNHPSQAPLPLWAAVPVAAESCGLQFPDPVVAREHAGVGDANTASSVDESLRN